MARAPVSTSRPVASCGPSCRCTARKSAVHLRSRTMYWLAPDVYVHVGEAGAIWLDVRHDRYFGQPREEIQGLAACVNGWPNRGEGPPTFSERACAIAEALVDRELLTRKCTGRSAAPPRLERVSSALLDDAEFGSSIRYAPRFALSCAKIWYRHRSLHRAMERVTVRATTRAWAEDERTRARHLVAAFTTLRRYAYTARRACLFDSLVLVEFLAHFDLYPQLVVGIQAQPFAAHFWVQQGATVLNDRPEHVRRYTPLLVAPLPVT